MSSLKPANDPSRALAMVGRYTRGRVRSSQEVLTYLGRRGVSPATATRVIAECRARGMLDDEACARLWADHWARRGYAWEAIRAKLAAKGVSGPVVDRAARRLGTAGDDEGRARHVVASYQRRPHAGGASQRLARALRARGFDPEVIERVLAEPTPPPLQGGGATSSPSADPPDAHER
jgi:SOS response regulatory protein OraA/RecX